MRLKTITRIVPALLFLLAAISALSLKSAAEQPPRNPTSVYDLFNQEAAISGPAGIHQYADDLIELIVSPGISNEIRQDVTDVLADRLARAEGAARAGHGKLVPEDNVVRAYNELMQEIGAPSSLRATEEPLRQFREYAASFKAFPALFTAGRNGTNCNPGEAVYLLYVLLWNDGRPSEEDLYSAWVMQQPGDQRQVPPRPNDRGNRGELGYAPGRPQWLLYRYSLEHRPATTVALFKNAAGTLGF